jgi:hypothetical protein
MTTISITEDDAKLITKEVEKSLNIKRPLGIEGVGHPLALIPVIKELGYGKNNRIKVLTEDNLEDSSYREFSTHLKMTDIQCKGYFCSFEVKKDHIVIIVNPKYS